MGIPFNIHSSHLNRVMGKREKRLDWILYGQWEGETDFSKVRLVLKDIGYREAKWKGSHASFVVMRGGKEEQKVVPTVKGRRVKKRYLERIRRNVQKMRGVSHET